MEDVQSLIPSALPVSILEDPAYSTGAMKWMARQVYEHGNAPIKLINPFDHQRLKILQDALANKNFEALKRSPIVAGLRVTSAFASGIQKPEFNLLEAAAVYDAEPYVRRSVTRQLNLWFKQGFTVTGSEAAAANADYIRKRLKAIAYVTGLPTQELFKMVTRSLLKYSNAFVIKVRDANFSTGIKSVLGRPPTPVPLGAVRQTNVVPNQENASKANDPVAGYFPVSPLNMFPRYNNGTLVSWVRLLRDGTRIQEFHPNDVIHFTFDREEDFLFGKPRTLGGIEDVAALRRIEENVEILMNKYLFPIFQLQVGTPEMPARYYPDGTSEIDMARMMVQNMENEGMLVTSERYKLDVVGSFKEALNANEYLKHFKTRLFAGLGVSAMDMGEGDTANRSTADNISQILKDMVIEDQKHFACQVQQFIFAELFLEHPAQISALNAFDTVALRFANVDLDNLIKSENHTINKYNNNLITSPEARLEMGRDPMTNEEFLKTHFNQIEIPLAIIAARDEPYTAAAKGLALANAKKALAGSAPKPGTGSNAGKKVPTGRTRVKRPGTPASRGPATANQPENQFGVNPGPTKAKSSLEKDLLGLKIFDLVGRLMLVADTKELNEVVKQRFPSSIDQKRILPIVEDALTNSSTRGDFRANLVTGLMGIAHHYSKPEQES